MFNNITVFDVNQMLKLEIERNRKQFQALTQRYIMQRLIKYSVENIDHHLPSTIHSTLASGPEAVHNRQRLAVQRRVCW